MKVAADTLSPIYPNKPIVNSQRLALLLNVPVERLNYLASNKESLYREVEVEKKDGSPRLTFDAMPELKSVQQKIVKKILQKVIFPRYLHGGIRDLNFPRDQLSNAAQHTEAQTLILDDVADFYPSISEKTVFNIWLHVFRFTPDIAELMTQLTTYQGSVPQGAKTSSYLANLAFWDIEGELVKKLKRYGLTYSRFVDDVSVSAPTKIQNKVKTRIRADIYGMMASKNCSPKRTKSQILHKGQQLKVTGLVTNSASPAVEKNERRRIRSAVHELEISAKAEGISDINQQRWRKTRGRVERLIRMKHPEGSKFMSRLNNIHPMIFGN